ncbi:MAG: hypothetical protein ACTHL7_05290 [Steroidobacteraceae bacterium]
MKGPTLALLALAAAGVAMAQTTPPPTTAEPPAAAAPDEQSQSPPPDSNASPNSADAQALMKDCMTQVQAANPNVSEKDIKAFCENEIAKSAQPRT